MKSLRGRCANVYREDDEGKPFLITKELTKDGRRRIIIHKQSGMKLCEYKKAKCIHEVLWAEVMNELSNMDTCYVCGTPCYEWYESRDWCYTCKNKNIWRCEYCNEIQYDKPYDTDDKGDAWCEECAEAEERQRAEISAGIGLYGRAFVISWVKRQEQIASKKSFD